MQSHIILLFLMMLVHNSEQEEILNKDQLKEYVFANQPKLWFIYVRKIIQININQLTIKILKHSETCWIISKYVHYFQNYL